MTEQKIKKPRLVSLICFFELAAVLIFTALKLNIFYSQLRIGPLSLHFCALTLFILCAVFAISLMTSKRYFMLGVGTVYTVLCILLAVDSVYYAYVGKLPSAVSLAYAGNLGAVTDSIASLIDIKKIAHIIDLPLWIIYILNIRRRVSELLPRVILDGQRRKGTDVKKRPFVPKKLPVAVLSVLCAVFLCVTLCAFLQDGFRLEYFKNEMITYHVADIIDALLPDAPPDVPTGDIFGGTEDDEPVQGDGGDEEGDGIFGLCEGKNLIVIQVEAMQSFVIGREYNSQEITPTLNALLKNDTIYFENYYYQIGGGNTADAEFTTLTSLYPPESEAAFVKYLDTDFYALPKILKDNGYGSATAFHGYKKDFWNRENAYPVMGFDEFIGDTDFNIDETIGLGLTDRSMFLQAVDYLKDKSEPFYAHMVTLSSHHPYYIASKYTTLSLLPEDVDTLWGRYLCTMRYVDESIAALIEALKAEGLYENTVIAIYGDHFGLPYYDAGSAAFMKKFLGHQYGFDDTFRVPLIFNIPGSGIGERRYSVTGGHVDFLPTLLYLLGIDNQKGAMFGNNLFLTEEGIVYQQTHLGRGSFISEDIIYYYPFSGIREQSEVYKKYTLEKVNYMEYYNITEEAKKVYSQCEYLIGQNMVVR